MKYAVPLRLALRLPATRKKAPVDGAVQQLAVHTVGGVVTPAQPLLATLVQRAAL